MFGINIQFEKWKFNKKYQIYVSTLGRFKNVHKQLIVPNVDTNGYLAISLKHINKNLKVAAHRAVMETFKPNNNGLTIDHLNQNKRDVRLKNLEWVTQEENIKRAKNNQTHSATIDNCYNIMNKMINEDKLSPEDIYNAIQSKRSQIVEKQKNIEKHNENAAKKKAKKEAQQNTLNEITKKREFSLPLLAALFIGSHMNLTSPIQDVEKHILDVLNSETKTKCYGMKIKRKDRGCVLTYKIKGENINE